MFIAVPEILKDCSKEIETNHWRLQAITISIPNNKILVINSYFPTDPKVSDFDTSDLLSTLSTISEILENEDFSAAVWTGDINASFLRNTKFTRIIDEFLQEKM